MRIGIGTYALFWESRDPHPHPLSIPAMVDRAAELGCEVFQICDDPRIEAFSTSRLEELRERAAERDVRLELGTRGIARDHLDRYLDIAERLGAPTLRSMVLSPEIARGRSAVVEELRGSLRGLERAGVTLALETYEQIPTAELVSVVEHLDSPHVGICLDPANCVSALEHPREVIDLCAPYTANLHVKDSRFTREDGWVGFSYTGAPLGEGLLDLPAELRSVYADGRTPSAIVEHWLPWQGDLGSTVAAERAWTDRTLNALRAWRAEQSA